jgi:hypothetical protein
MVLGTGRGWLGFPSRFSNIYICGGYILDSNYVVKIDTAGRNEGERRGSFRGEFLFRVLFMAGVYQKSFYLL